MQPGQQPSPGQQPQRSGQQGGQGYPGHQAYFADPGYRTPSSPPPRKNTGLVVGLIAAVVVLIAGATTGVILLLNNSDTGPGSSAQEAAETFVDAYNDHDAERLNGVLCADSRISAEDVRRIGDQWGTVSLKSVGVGDPAEVEFEVTDGFAGDSGDSVTMQATSGADGTWTLCENSDTETGGPDGTTVTG